MKSVVKPRDGGVNEASTKFINTLFNNKETYVAAVLLSFLDFDII